MLWVALAVALGVGSARGGWGSLALARRGDLEGAARRLRVGCLSAGVAGAALTTLTLGWPWKPVSVSVPEDVVRTVSETVDVPVEVTRWLFLRRTVVERRAVERQVTETRYRPESGREFSAWLLAPMLAVGVGCSYAQKGLTRLAWRLLG